MTSGSLKVTDRRHSISHILVFLCKYVCDRHMGRRNGQHCYISVALLHTHATLTRDKNKTKILHEKRSKYNARNSELVQSVSRPADKIRHYVKMSS